MEDLTGLDFSKQPKEGAPGFYEFTFDAEETGDTFLDFEGWGKGCAFIERIQSRAVLGRSDRRSACIFQRRF